MDFKYMHVLFSLVHIFYIRLFEIHEKFTHILPFTSTVSPVHMLYIDAVELCFVFAIFIYLFIFFLTGCGLFRDTKIKEAVDVALLFFSSNQLASETQSF